MTPLKHQLIERGEIGKRFGQLVVLKEVAKTKQYKTWLCKCDCGTIKKYRRTNVTFGHTKSCGCQMVEIARKTKTTHGASTTRLYMRYRSMINRCYYPKRREYPLYGGRGIKVCDEWRNSYEAFQKWALNNGYADNLSLDRIDVNGGYNPSNCRWATIAQQQRNKRNNVSYKGEISVDASRRLGGSPQLVGCRIRLGWPIEKAFTTPARTVNRLSDIATRLNLK